MRKMVLVLLCLMSAAVACAQTAKEAAAAFENSLQTGHLVLRNFSGEDQVRGTWTASGLELAEPGWRTMGVMQVNSAKLNKHDLKLRCTRRAILIDEKNEFVLHPFATTVEINVDLGTADPVEILPKLKEALFYDSIHEAVSALPNDIGKMVPQRVEKRVAEPTDDSKPACDCLDREKLACDADHRRIVGMVPPKVLRSKDPGYTEQARGAGLTGNVLLDLIVAKDGRPEDIWVIHSLGMGLDEEAAKSVLAYEFRPAMCHQTPVKVYLNVQVNFAIP